MYKGGRPKDAIWSHFESVTVDNKPYARCKSCLTITTAAYW